MALFSSTVFQNEFLPDGGTDVNAIVRVGVTDAGSAGSNGAAGEIVIIDCSGSMGQRSMMAARRAAMAALDNILDGTYFAIVSGTHEAYLAYPIVQSGPGMVQMNGRTRREAKDAISRLVADGGTAIGRWLSLAQALFNSMGGKLTQKHALLLTDGADEHETPERLDAAIRSCVGKFQCDCRGVGTYWVVSEVRKISRALMGTLDIIPDPVLMAAETVGLFVDQAVGEAVEKYLKVLNAEWLDKDYTLSHYSASSKAIPGVPDERSVFQR